MKLLGVTILQRVEFPIFPINFAWALQQQRYCAACDRVVMRRVALILEYTMIIVSELETHAVCYYQHWVDSVYCKSKIEIKAHAY